MDVARGLRLRVRRPARSAGARREVLRGGGGEADRLARQRAEAKAPPPLPRELDVPARGPAEDPALRRRSRDQGCETKVLAQEWLRSAVALLARVCAWPPGGTGQSAGVGPGGRAQAESPGPWLGALAAGVSQPAPRAVGDRPGRRRALPPASVARFAPEAGAPHVAKSAAEDALAPDADSHGPGAVGAPGPALSLPSGPGGGDSRPRSPGVRRTPGGRCRGPSTGRRLSRRQEEGRSGHSWQRPSRPGGPQAAAREV